MKTFAKLMIGAAVCLTTSAYAGLDPLRPACVRDCIESGGESQVCYANCWYCNVHNSWCPDLRYFCGYDGLQRTGWMVNVTTLEANRLGDEVPAGATYRARPIGSATFEIVRVLNQNPQQPVEAVGVLRQLSFEVATFGGATLTRQACEATRSF